MEWNPGCSRQVMQWLCSGLCSFLHSTLALSIFSASSNFHSRAFRNRTNLKVYIDLGWMIAIMIIIRLIFVEILYSFHVLWSVIRRGGGLHEINSDWPIALYHSLRSRLGLRRKTHKHKLKLTCRRHQRNRLHPKAVPHQTCVYGAPVQEHSVRLLFRFDF